MLMINIEDVRAALQRENPLLTDESAGKYAAELIDSIDVRLQRNVREWIEGKPITDDWFGKYCINAIMSIRGDHDFLGALEAMNLYLHDEDAGVKKIWRMKR